jgi:hypothetical protein
MAVSIALLGNCQVSSLAECARALLPDARITTIMLEKVLRAGDAEPQAGLAASHDIILSQEVTREGFGSLRTEALAESGPRFLLYPKVLFTGFHPDAHSVIDGGRVVASPLGAYHSEILIAAFVSGFRLDQAIGLFRAEVYQRLGYFREYAKSRDYLLGAASDLGFDLAGEMEAWLAHGPFMHTFNHPKARVMGSIARQAFERLDLPMAEVDFRGVRDVLAQSAHWPVYPEIAAGLGLSDPFVFTRSVAAGGEALSLPDFAADSYEIYRGLAPDLLAGAVHPRRLDAVAGMA